MQPLHSELLDIPHLQTRIKDSGFEKLQGTRWENTD